MNQTDTPTKVASNDQLGPLPEPLFLLHTGAMYDGERSDWDVEANSGAAVDSLSDTHPGQTLGLYSAPQVLAMLAAERERCAELCRAYAVRHAVGDDSTKAQAWMMMQCAADIRGPNVALSGFRRTEE